MAPQAGARPSPALAQASSLRGGRGATLLGLRRPYTGRPFHIRPLAPPSNGLTRGPGFGVPLLGAAERARRIGARTVDGPPSTRGRPPRTTSSASGAVAPSPRSTRRRDRARRPLVQPRPSPAPSALL